VNGMSVMHIHLNGPEGMPLGVEIGVHVPVALMTPAETGLVLGRPPAAVRPQERGREIYYTSLNVTNIMDKLRWSELTVVRPFESY